MKQRKKTIWLTCIFAALQMAIMAALFYGGKGDYLRSVMISTCAWLVYTVLEIKYRIRLSTYIRILMMITIFFDSLFGYYFNLYETSGLFDKLQHIFGTYSFSLFTYVLLMRLQRERIHPAISFVMVFCLGMSLGAVYELLEFIGDHVSHPLPPNQPSLLDTDFDLAGDFVGALIAAFHVLYHEFLGKKRNIFKGRH